MKKLFSTPKRAVISTICITAVFLTAAVAVPTAVLGSTLIGKSEAEKTAFADAGLNASEVSGCRTELDFEDGHFQYEVDFYSNGTEYEYLILAKDGGIISRDTDGERNVNASRQNENNEKSAQSGNASVENETSDIRNTAAADESSQASEITLEEAKAAALKDAELSENDVTFTKTQLDRDDNIKKYDIEFYTAEAEYDYEINAADGAVKERSIDTFRIQTDAESVDAAPSDKYIGIDNAKAIALKHAGLTEAEIQFSKAKLENDDGRSEYEVEFYFGNTEYDYSIDASTGEILEFNSEID